MKPADVQLGRYNEYGVEHKGIYPIFEIGDYATTSKYKNISAKSYIPSWSEKVFVIKEIKTVIPWKYVISDLKGE